MWNKALKAVAASKLQHGVGVHEEALLWRDLYRGDQGSAHETTEYQGFMEEWQGRWLLGSQGHTLCPRRGIWQCYKLQGGLVS